MTVFEPKKNNVLQLKCLTSPLSIILLSWHHSKTYLTASKFIYFIIKILTIIGMLMFLSGLISLERIIEHDYFTQYSLNNIIGAYSFIN